MPKIPRRRWRIAWLLGWVCWSTTLTGSTSQSHMPLCSLPSASRMSRSAIFPRIQLDLCAVSAPGRRGAGQLWRTAGGAQQHFSLECRLVCRRRCPQTGQLFCRPAIAGDWRSSTFPSNAKAIGYWFPAKERSSATSIFDGAAKFASAIGVPLIGMLLLKVGWRWSFAATGS